MSDPIRMSEGQLTKVKNLICCLCANYDQGNCLLLDDGYDPCPCPQMIANTLLCRYFRSAVLPADRELWAEIMGAGKKRCARCGSTFTPTGNRALYCKRCAAVRARERKSNWARKNRGRSRRFGP